MKCTECGKNIAVYHFVSNINGEVNEAHLCEECARKAKESGSQSAWNKFDDLMEESFNGFFNDPFMRRMTKDTGLERMLSGHSLLNSFFNDDLFDIPAFGTMMLPAFFLPVRRAEKQEMQENRENTEGDTAGKDQAAKKDGIDEKIAKRRQISALKEQMHRAARAEDYEKAAKLRDEIKALENRAE